MTVGAITGNTDDKGETILSLTAGDYSASISKTGYTTKTEQVKVTGKTTVNVALVKS